MKTIQNYIKERSDSLNTDAMKSTFDEVIESHKNLLRQGVQESFSHLSLLVQTQRNYEKIQKFEQELKEVKEKIQSMTSKVQGIDKSINEARKKLQYLKENIKACEEKKTHTKEDTSKYDTLLQKLGEIEAEIGKAEKYAEKYKTELLNEAASLNTEVESFERSKKEIELALSETEQLPHKRATLLKEFERNYNKKITKIPTEKLKDLGDAYSQKIKLIADHGASLKENLDEIQSLIRNIEV